MRRVNLALVGISGFGGLYLDRLLDKTDERICVCGFVEPYPESCKRLNDIKSRNIPIYSTLNQLYDNHKIDLTVIVSPIAYHTENILTALENASNVLCEKPLCADEADIELIEEAQKKSGKFVYIGYQWSFSRAISSLKDEILSGTFGKCIAAKSIVLWPRDKKYFSRSCGWAGKISLDSGKLVYDSVLNNATAHYLHNILFLLGEKSNSATPKGISATLLRANKIENFDAAKLTMSFDFGARATIIAAHCIDCSLEPTFHMSFEKADVYFSARRDPVSRDIMPERYNDFGQIVAIFKNGKEMIFGDPFAESFRKLDLAVQALIDESYEEGPCGIKAASAHTKVINYIQKNFEITDIPENELVCRGELVYQKGLFDKCINAYKDTSLDIK